MMMQQKQLRQQLFRVATYGPDWVQADFLDARCVVFLNRALISSVWVAEVEESVFEVVAALDEPASESRLAVLGRYKSESDALRAAIAFVMSETPGGDRQQTATNLAMLIASKIDDQQLRSRLLSLVGDLARS